VALDRIGGRHLNFFSKYAVVLPHANVRQRALFTGCFVAQYAYTLAWSRTDGQRLSLDAMDDGQGSLHIHNVQPSNEATYRCTGSNYYSIATDEAVLNIGC